MQHREESVGKPVTYAKLFWLFLIGSVLGVGIEGIFCLVCHGHWESHVVSVWGPFCILYGFGAVGFYVGYFALRRKKRWIQFFVYSAVGGGIELLCGALLEFGLHMRAWDYSGHFLQFRGYVSLKMTLVWGLVGLLFSLLVPSVERGLQRLETRLLRGLALLLGGLMLVDFALTGAAIWRWKERHFGVPPQNQLEVRLDAVYDDAFMESRFCEWHFLEDGQTE